MGYQVFISYARDDCYNQNKEEIPGNVVSKIKDALDSNNINYWIDTEEIIPAQEYNSAIASAIDNSDILISILSEKSCSSKYVYREISYALSLDKVVIPVLMIKENDIPNRIRFLLTSTVEYVDYLSSPNNAIQKLISSINQHLQAKDTNIKLTENLRNYEKQKEDIANKTEQYRQYIERFQMELEAMTKDYESLGVNIRMRKESLQLLGVQMEKLQSENENVLSQIEELQHRINSLVKDESISQKIDAVDSENADVDINMDFDISSEETLKEESKSIKIDVSPDEPLEKNDSADKPQDNIEESKSQNTENNLNEKSRQFMMGYFKRS